MGTEADHKQIMRQSPCLIGQNGNYKHGKVYDQNDQWTMIMEGDHDHQDTSSTLSLEDSSISNGSSTSSSELVDDASSTSTSSSSLNSHSSSNSNGPLFELSELMAQLPIKRGLSKYYQGKSQSFTSLSRVMSLEDLAKKESPYRKKMKTCKSYGGGLDIKATISKKVSRSSFYSSSSYFSASRKSSFLGSSKPPPIPVQKHF